MKSMNWDKLKENEDIKQERKMQISELKERWDQLNVECLRKYLQFDVETEDAKQAIEIKAIEGFKQYFQSKGFNLVGDNKNLNAKYNTLNVVLSITPEGHGFSIHFYKGKPLSECRVFELQIAKEFDGNYKQLLVDEVTEKTTLESAILQVQALERNKKSIDALLADKDKIRFVFELDSHHSGMSGQFENIEAILDTLN